MYYDTPGYLWVMIIGGIVAILATTCVVLYTGAIRAGLGRPRAGRLAGGAAVVLGGWLAASAVIADRGWYHTRLGHGVPWLPVAVVGFLGLLLALSRIPVVARVLRAPGMVARLELPHSFRAVDGLAFLIIMGLGPLPALGALPLGAVTASQLIHVPPPGAPISELPIAIVPTVGVPLLLAVHITSVTALARSRRTPKPVPALITATAK